MRDAEPLGVRETLLVETYLEFTEDAKFLVGTTVLGGHVLK